MSDPLILTLAMDEESFAWLDGLRQAHFPDRGYRLPAHLTLFHHLPGDARADIDARLEALCDKTAPFGMQAVKVMDFNPGAAIRVESDQLKRLRKDLAKSWSDWLTPQDQHFHSHVTVQNKVAAKDSVWAELDAAFEPFEVTATGLLLWHYRQGPWERAARFDFTGPQTEIRAEG
ncbi:2'-5' RNA ligase family protein [Salipiger sp. IMCC34102]|uniref:2'-5' RNA ligase family protein n=1 Tax=Salipiger sp. IMCC34102 TaxID=2510647 RepID=UPI00101BF380|nr:2'-5' RNA ligase family protein [Salipiger sp. IMCC34102]RYH03529.1 2'-5' RNA ligase family protein [Salipiger sp. IMCC34102]